ncbi:MAG: SH3 domain-containing protein [Clostridiales bacterium]|nr:SH3 domain-containing protein [Clostridiales bacterium]
MKKKILAFALLLAMVLSSVSAYAAPARFLKQDNNSAYHAEHLRNHIGSENCKSSGDYVKVRVSPGSEKLRGHLEQSDAFILEEIDGNWARITVTYAARTSPNSFVGLTGWVNADYIECPCSSDEYYTGPAHATYSLATVSQATANLREEPSRDSTLLAKASQGEELQVLSAYTGSDGKVWYRVRYGSQMGFIRNDMIEIAPGEIREFPEPTPTEVTTPEPTEAPTPEPTEAPTAEPPAEPAAEPTEVPTEAPADSPSAEPEETIAPEPTEFIPPVPETTPDPTFPPPESGWENAYYRYIVGGGYRFQSHTEGDIEYFTDPLGLSYYPYSMNYAGETIPVSFALYDWNLDGIPELFAYDGDSGKSGSYYAFTFLDGQMMYIGTVGSGWSGLLPYRDGETNVIFSQVIDGPFTEIWYAAQSANGAAVRQLIAGTEDVYSGEDQADTVRVVDGPYNQELYDIFHDLFLRDFFSGSFRFDSVGDVLPDNWWPDFVENYYNVCEQWRTQQTNDGAEDSGEEGPGENDMQGPDVTTDNPPQDDTGNHDASADSDPYIDHEEYSEYDGYDDGFREEDLEPQNTWAWGDPEFYEFMDEYGTDRTYNWEGYRELTGKYNPNLLIPVSDRDNLTMRYGTRGLMTLWGEMAINFGSGAYMVKGDYYQIELDGQMSVYDAEGNLRLKDSYLSFDAVWMKDRYFYVDAWNGFSPVHSVYDENLNLLSEKTHSVMGGYYVAHDDATQTDRICDVNNRVLASTPCGAVWYDLYCSKCYPDEVYAVCTGSLETTFYTLPDMREIAHFDRYKLYDNVLQSTDDTRRIVFLLHNGEMVFRKEVSGNKAVLGLMNEDVVCIANGYDSIGSSFAKYYSLKTGSEISYPVTQGNRYITGMEYGDTKIHAVQASLAGLPTLDSADAIPDVFPEHGQYPYFLAGLDYTIASSLNKYDGTKIAFIADESNWSHLKMVDLRNNEVLLDLDNVAEIYGPAEFLLSLGYWQGEYYEIPSLIFRLYDGSWIVCNLNFLFPNDIPAGMELKSVGPNYIVFQAKDGTQYIHDIQGYECEAVPSGLYVCQTY